MILAGGLGKRLRPLVADRPKPLALIDGEPFLARQLRHLRGFGFERFVICVGYRAEMVIETLGDGAELGLRIEYAVEEQPLGTAGALKNAAPLIAGGGPFVVLNGDTFVELAVDRLIDHQRREATAGALGTVCVKRLADAAGKGVVRLDADERWISAFDEKALAGEPALINAGVYAFEPALLERIPAGRAVSLETEVFPGLLAAGERLGAMRTGGRMLDIGTPEDYQRAQRELADVGGQSGGGLRGGDRSGGEA